MDKDLEKALDFSNYMNTLNNQKRLLWEEFQESIIYYHNGGKFTITLELINFCSSLNVIAHPILIDDNQIPIKIKNDEFLLDIQQQYKEASEKYFEKYSKLKSNRKLKDMFDL